MRLAKLMFLDIVILVVLYPPYMFLFYKKKFHKKLNLKNHKTLRKCSENSNLKCLSCNF